MTIVDYNNNASRLYSIVIGEVLKEEKEVYKKTGVVTPISDEKFKEINKFFFNIMIDSLTFIKEKLVPKYGDIVICSDYRKDIYWRKQISPIYKANRDEKSNEFDNETWKKFNDHRKMMLQAIKFLGFNCCTDITTIMNKQEVSLEADEIMAVLSATPGIHAIYSTDSDLWQTMMNNPNVYIFHPILKKLVDKKKSEIKEKNILSCLVGQKKDNIMSIYYRTSINPEFIKWMKSEKNITITDDMLETIKEDKYSDYREEFKKAMYEEDTLMLEEGKRKSRRNLDAFNKNGLGDTGAKKLLDKYKGDVDKILVLNPLYRETYELNEELYYFDRIPDEIRQAILDKYKNMKKEPDNNKITQLAKFLGLGMLDQHKLKELAK